TYDTSSFVFPSLNAKSGESEWKKFDRVEIDRGGTKIELVRDKNAWTVNGLRANAHAVEEMIRSLVEARRDKLVGPPAHPSDGKRDKPRAVVTLKKGGDPKGDVKLTVGGDSIGGGSGLTYVQSSERGDEALAVPRSVVQAALGDVNSFRDRDLL